MNDPVTLNRADLWGLVLAGGEGRRLELYVRQLRGESLPKQYVNFIGTRSMIEHTFDRAERLIPRQRILSIVTEHHLSLHEVRRQLSHRAAGTVIVQPQNKDTGPGMLLPLTYLYKLCPDATVAVFPSDHCILEEDRFIDHVRLAVRAVQHDPSQIVLLGIEAQWPETEYGYVIPADFNGDIDMCGCRNAAHFVEKPDLADARLLVAAGALWNTMIMVFRVETFLHHIRKLFPNVASQFHSFAKTIGTAAEKDKIQELYSGLRPLNFSKDILERISARFPSAVSVLPVLQVTWSDWGSPQRLLETKKSLEQRVNSPSPPVTTASGRAGLPTSAVGQTGNYGPPTPIQISIPDESLNRRGCRRSMIMIPPNLARSMRLIGVATTVLALAMASAPFVARSQIVRSGEESARILAIEKLAVQEGMVSGEVRNKSNHPVRDVQLFVRYTWLWDDERNPGRHDPGTSTYYTLKETIQPNSTINFVYKPSPPLPKSSGGRFDTSVTIAGFTEIIPQP